MPMSDFVEFMVFEGIEPFATRGEWLRTGLICSTMANIHRSSSSREFKPTDFMPSFDPPRQQTQAEIFAVMNMLMAASQGNKSEAS